MHSRLLGGGSEVNAPTEPLSEPQVNLTGLPRMSILGVGISTDMGAGHLASLHGAATIITRLRPAQLRRRAGEDDDAALKISTQTVSTVTSSTITSLIISIMYYAMVLSILIGDRAWVPLLASTG